MPKKSQMALAGCMILSCKHSSYWAASWAPGSVIVCTFHVLTRSGGCMQVLDIQYGNRWELQGNQPKQKTARGWVFRQVNRAREETEREPGVSHVCLTWVEEQGEPSKDKKLAIVSMKLSLGPSRQKVSGMGKLPALYSGKAVLEQRELD